MALFLMTGHLGALRPPSEVVGVADVSHKCDELLSEGLSKVTAVPARHSADVLSVPRLDSILPGHLEGAD